MQLCRFASAKPEPDKAKKLFDRNSFWAGRSDLSLSHSEMLFPLTIRTRIAWAGGQPPHPNPGGTRNIRQNYQCSVGSACGLDGGARGGVSGESPFVSRLFFPINEFNKELPCMNSSIFFQSVPSVPSQFHFARRILLYECFWRQNLANCSSINR
jgi:hypothetical protein